MISNNSCDWLSHTCSLNQWRIRQNRTTFFFSSYESVIPMLAFGFRSILCRMNLLWLFDQAFSRNTELIMQTPDHYHANAGSLASSRNGTNARPDVFADPFDSCRSYPPVT